MTQEHTDQKPPDRPTGEQIMAACQEAQKTVIEPLMKGRMAVHVEDVVGATAEAVWRSIDGFDPARGNLVSWVKRIAHRRVADCYREIETRSEVQLAEDDGRSSEAQMDQHLQRSTRGHIEDPAELYARIEGVRVYTDPLLNVVSKVLDDRRFVTAWMVYLRYHGSVEEAAEHISYSKDEIRRAVRSFKVHIQVTQAAISARRKGATGSIDELISCLPDDDVQGGWVRTIACAIRAWVLNGGLVEDVDRSFVCQSTGFSHNTVRQRLPEVQHLLRVAYTVIIHPRSLEDPHQEEAA